jgi:hypothetical protein
MPRTEVGSRTVTPASIGNVKERLWRGPVKQRQCFASKQDDGAFADHIALRDAALLKVSKFFTHLSRRPCNSLILRNGTTIALGLRDFSRKPYMFTKCVSFGLGLCSAAPSLAALLTFQVTADQRFITPPGISPMPYEDISFEPYDFTLNGSIIPSSVETTVEITSFPPNKFTNIRNNYIGKIDSSGPFSNNKFVVGKNPGHQVSTSLSLTEIGDQENQFSSHINMSSHINETRVVEDLLFGSSYSINIYKDNMISEELYKQLEEIHLI